MQRAWAVVVVLAAGLWTSRAAAQLAGYPTAGSVTVEPEVNLTPAAQASPRPAECAPPSGRGAAARTTWDRARRPAEAEWCDALARGYTVLVKSPDRALLAARRAEQLQPGSAASAVLEGRALLGLGDARGAWQAFERARKISRRSLEAPAVLHAAAIAALALGRRADALAAYRALVPRAGLLPDARQRQRVYVEAALVVMAQSREHLDEAIGYLAEARRRRAESGLGDVALGALGLALDRLGRIEEARGVTAEAGGPFTVMRLGEQAPASRPLFVAEADLHAIAATLAERKHPEVARSEWQAYVKSEDSTSPWLAHARKKLEGGATKPKKKAR